MGLNPWGRDKFGFTNWDYLSLFNRREELFSKLSSRKLWATVAAATLSVFGQQLGLPPDAIATVVKLVTVYVIGQGVVDAATAVSKK